MLKIDFNNIKKTLKKKQQQGKDKKVQATYHQHLAVNCAEALDDMESLPIYMRLFKKYPEHNLHACRDWVLNKSRAKNKGRVFVRVFFKHFLK